MANEPAKIDAPAVQDPTSTHEALGGKPIPKETPKPAPEPAKEAAKEAPVVADPEKKADEPVSKEAKPPEEKKPVVPEKYDLKLPKGSLLDPARVDTIASFAKEQGLSNAQAQLVLERESDAVGGYQAKAAETLKTESQKWLTDMKADPEFGGEAFSKNVETAKRVVARFGDESFKKALDETGLGNHPGLVKTFIRIGRLMSEDQLVIPGTEQPTAERSMEDVFYGETTAREKAAQ